MQAPRFAHLTAALLLVALAVPARPAAAAPRAAGGTETLCRRVYVPMVMGSSPSNEPVPLGPSFNPSECQGTPDFNGDGYADLAIGVPGRAVPNGAGLQAEAGVVQVIYGGPGGLDAGAGASGPDDQLFHHALSGVGTTANDHYGAALAMGDFNADGYDDLAVGIPGADIDGHNDAGAVQVIYGGPAGLKVTAITHWARGHNGLQGTSEVDDEFGTALAAGDFDGDGYADLAASAPYATVGGDAQAGAVSVLYGRAGGLAALGNELLTQDVGGFDPTSAEAGDEFGYALTAGDFDHDFVDDLAVGTPFEDNGASFVNAGAVQVFYGMHAVGDGGLIRYGAVSDAAQHWTADSDNVDGVMEAGELFGYAVAAGDFDGDGYDDLALGTPRENHGSGPGTITYGGSLNIIRGGGGGLVATAGQPARIWHQDVTDMADEVAPNELFGQALAAGDFNDDGYADLAIGVPGNQTLGVSIGAVHVMYGTSNGVTAADDELLWDPINAQLLDWFGRTLTVGDFDGDGFVDLAVGAPQDDPAGVALTDSGSVFVFYPNADGVDLNVYQNWYPNHLGLLGAPVDDDNFGSGLPGSPDRP
jgi:hypothetical protein